jgi:hypothetical protein
MLPVYSAGWQGTKVRLVMWASVAALAVSTWYGYELFQTYGLRQADGGRLASLGVRTAWFIGLVSLGAGFFLGMWVYGRRYIAAIRMDDASSVVEFDTLGWFGTRTLQSPASAVHLGRFHAGAFSGRVSVKAPWTAVRIDGLRRRLILDAQGRLIDESFPARLRATKRTPNRR